ncbi:MAG: C69 family dipeptidase [Planctomycetes bacterium]|nr:C69 family dipeptidase [Planctomycetota bacterium]MBL7142794.1 C69 family dipeptidase [Phycisphaerae bacterium]
MNVIDINNRYRRFIVLIGLIGSLVWTHREALACSTILVGKKATYDGSVLMSSSCDGDIMGLIYVMPAQQYPQGTKLPMYWNLPRPRTHEEYLSNLRKGYDLVGYLPVTETYRSIILAGNVENMTTGGMNEHGLSIAIEFLPMRSGLACTRGVVGPNSNHWTTSLIANGLMRARTAREAIRIIGAMIEQYGFQYYRAPNAGVALPIADDKEVWLMEIFGPGQAWTANSGKPGGVWCAQRIPDGEIGCSANRSRIGKVDLKNPDMFMTSPNIHSLAEELGIWKRSDPFVWHDVYGDPGSSYNSLREWRALSLAAPSLSLQVTGDPLVDRYPFSVKPDRPLTVQRLFAVMRDGYEGTKFDLTEYPAFNPQGKKSSLARPWGPTELFDLLGIKPERALCTPTSGYVFVAQLRDWLPDTFGNCLWFAYGPAYTSCFVPIYAGVTDLPDAWDQAPDYTRINTNQVPWNFRLVFSLANNLRYQDAMKDIQHVFRPAETAFFKIQTHVERTAAEVLRKDGTGGVQRFLNTYTEHCLTQVGYAYKELVDYLMFMYLVDHSEVAPPKLPAISAPIIPAVPDN